MNDKKPRRGTMKAIAQKRQPKQGLYDDESKFRYLVYHSIHAVVSLEDEDRIKLWNPAAETLLHYCGREVAGQDFSSLIIAPEFRETYKQAVKQMFEAYDPPLFRKALTVSVMPKSGEKFESILYLCPLTRGNHPEYCVILCEHAGHENHVENSQYWGEALAIEQAAIGVAYVDAKGKWLRMNKAYCHILGYSQAELMSMTLRDIAYQDDWEIDSNCFNKVSVREMTHRTWSRRYQRKDKSAVWVNMTISPIWDVGGDLRYFIVVMEDITERKQAEDALKQSEERYRLVEQATHDTIYDWDLMTHALYWNKNVQTMFKYTPQQMSAAIYAYEWWAGHVHPDDRERVVSSLSGAINSGNHFWSEEYRFICGDDSIVVVLDRGYIVFNEQNKPIRMIGSMIDITVQKQAEEKLQQAKAIAETLNDKKSEFLAMITHELRTPLNTVLGYSQMLENNLAGALTDKQHKYIHNINISGQHLLSLINEILDISSIETGQLEILPQKVYLPTFMKDLENIFTDMARQKEVHLRFWVQSCVESMTVDPIRLYQIFSNLINNAIKFNTVNGTVEVHVHYSDNKQWLVCDVSDTGTGMTEKELEELFHPMTPRETSSKRKQESTGLGLYLTKNLVELLGGTISVQSKKGEGSTFTFTLPHKIEG